MLRRGLATLAVITVTLIGHNQRAEADIQPPGPKVALICSVDGGAFKVKNNQQLPLEQGTRVYAKTSRGESEPKSIVLSAALAPSQTISIPAGSVTGECTGWFFPGTPDFTILSMQWTSEVVGGKVFTAAKVRMQNKNKFVAAPTSKTRVTAMNCSKEIIDTKTGTAPGIPPNGIVEFKVWVEKKGAPFAFFKGEANYDNGVVETNKSNNVNDQYEPSCVPN